LPASLAGRRLVDTFGKAIAKMSFTRSAVAAGSLASSSLFGRRWSATESASPSLSGWAAGWLASGLAGWLIVAVVFPRMAALASEPPAELQAGVPVGLPAGSPAADDDTAVRDDAPGARLFLTDIAPLLAKHCLECHDTATAEGGLDLSLRLAAEAGGDSGPVLSGDRPEEALLWQRVVSGEMPPEPRPPLDELERAKLQQWLSLGAPWAIEAIEPGDFLGGARQAQGWLRRLTRRQYAESLRRVLAVELTVDELERIPADVRADGFTNTAYSQGVDLGHVQAFSYIAKRVAARFEVDQLTARLQSLQQRLAAIDNSAGGASLGDRPPWLEPLGLMLFRGPLLPQELELYQRLIETVIEQEGGTQQEAMRWTVEAILQAPRFVYLVELTEAEREVDLEADDARRGAGRLSLPPQQAQYELAARLSYLVVGGPPDEELLLAAAGGRLHDEDTFQAQLDRLLDDPRSEQRAIEFAKDWLNLDRLQWLQPGRHRYPHWDPALARDMQAESLLYFRQLALEQQRPLSELFNTRRVWASPRLAAWYDLPWDFEHAAEQHLHFTSPDDPLRIEQLKLPQTEADRPAVLYRFELDPDRPDTVADESGFEPRIDLAIQSPEQVRWGADGLEILRPTTISSRAVPDRLLTSIAEADAFTLEVWLRPSQPNQTGPARIVSFSGGSSVRNFTLGQDGGRYSVRLRSTGTNTNGMPDLAGEPDSLSTWLTHVAFVRHPGGRTELFVNGLLQNEGVAAGRLDNWDASFPLLLGNEASGDRPWLGTLRRLAIYPRALPSDEVRARAVGMLPLDTAERAERGGLLTQGSLLTIGGDEASMVTRGLFVLQDVLHSRVGNPPPGVDTTPKPSEPGLSQRDMALARLADASCRGCHVKFEPLAFGLERFDGLGAYQERDEHGNPLAETGQLLFPGEGESRHFASIEQMMDLLAASHRVQWGLTRKLVQFAIARPLTAEDRADLEIIHRRAWQAGGGYRELLTAIAHSRLLR